MLVENRRRVFRRERRPAGNQLIEHATQRVHIGGLPRRLTPRPLGGEVVRAADNLARRRERARPFSWKVSDAEIRDLHGPVRRQQQVARFHVTMNDVLQVRRGQARGRLFDDVDRAVLRQRSLLSELRGDSAAFDQLHHQEEAFVVTTEVVHRDHMRVAQPRGSSRLPLKSFARSGVLIRRQQQLDRDNPPQQFVRGTEHLPHAAPTDRGAQSVPLSNKHPDPRTQPQPPTNPL